jgi:hypothetical protein
MMRLEKGLKPQAVLDQRVRRSRLPGSQPLT